MPDLVDEIRVPLHELQADVDYLIGRVIADASCASTIAASIKGKLTAIEAAILTRAEPQSSSMASDDPTASKEWNDGCDFAMTQLCKFLDVEPSSVSWDAATETVEGDVSAVIGNILRAKFGEDWEPQCQAGSEHDLAEHIKSIADDCREDFNTCPQCGYEDHTAIKNSNLLLLIDSALTRHEPTGE